MTVERGSAAERGAYLMLTGTALCFGGTWVPAVWAVEEVPPFAVATVRFAVASLLLLIWSRRAGRGLAAVRRADLPLILGLGLTAVAGYNWLFLTGLTLAPASDGAIIVPGLAPVFTALLAAPILGERLGRRGLLGFAIAFAGLLLVIGPAGTASETRTIGDLLFLAGAVFWGIYSVLVRLASSRFDAFNATFYAMSTGTLVLLPLALLEGGGGELLAASGQAWFGMAYLAVFGSVAAFVWFNSGVARIGAARAAAFAYLVPVVGVTTSALFLGEPLSILTLVGGAVVLAGVWLIQTRHRRAAPTPSPGAEVKVS